MFSFACTHTFSHVSLFEEHKPTISRVQLRIYVHATSFSMGGISTDEYRIKCPSPSSFAFSWSFPSWIFHLRFFSLFVTNAPLWPVQIARTKPHGHHLDLNFALPYHAHFSPSSILTFRHVLILPASIVLTHYHYYFVIRTTRLAPSSPRLMLNEHRFRFPPAKSEHARYIKFFPLWHSCFLYD